MLTACYTSAALLIFGLPSADRRSFTLVGSNEPPGSRALSKTCLFAELRMPKALCHCGGEGADPRSVRSSERKGAPSMKMWAERRSSTGAAYRYFGIAKYMASHTPLTSLIHAGASAGAAPFGLNARERRPRGRVQIDDHHQDMQTGSLVAYGS